VTPCVRLTVLATTMALVCLPTARAEAAQRSAYRLALWPHEAPSPDFSLRGVDGNARTLANYRGRIVVVLFGFLHCPDACPTELFRLAQVMKRLGSASRQVQVLFITLDPQRDSPAALRNYVRAFDHSFIGLTGSTGEIEQAANRFAVQYARVSQGDDYTIDHSTAIYVFDGRGVLTLVGSLSSPEADLFHDIRELVHGLRLSTGVH